MFSKIKKIILDTLFPIQCLSCKKDGFWICKKCLDRIDVLSVQVCPYCEKIETPFGKICYRCKDNFLAKNKTAPVDNLIPAVRYKDVSHFIHLFKYRLISDLHKPLGKMMIKAILKNNWSLPDLIIPIPLHKKRLRWRGFNQSELLANFISSNLTPGMEIPVIANIIFRKKYTVPQMKIKNYGERQKNMRNIFDINKNLGYNLENKTILVVDDIATTGSTLFECGKILKVAGAEKVMAIVIARQEIKKITL